jgi:hypothetical protein
MITPIEEMQLVKEVELATRAKQAFDLYFKDFFEEKEAIIIEAFRSAPVGDSAVLMNIHLMYKALDAHKHDILTKIETGKMATVQLNAAEETRQ